MLVFHTIKVLFYLNYLSMMTTVS